MNDKQNINILSVIKCIYNIKPGVIVSCCVRIVTSVLNEKKMPLNDQYISTFFKLSYALNDLCFAFPTKLIEKQS